VEVIGVDEHAWRHTRFGPKWVTVVIDLTPVRDGRGPARLLDMVEGRSKQASKDWLQARGQTFRDRIQVVAMDLLHRVQDSRPRRAARRGGGDGPVPRPPPRLRGPGPGEAAGPAGHPGSRSRMMKSTPWRSSRCSHSTKSRTITFGKGIISGFHSSSAVAQETQSSSVVVGL
jgi:hypothetical protein